MQIVITEKNKTRINTLIDWLLYMAGYTIVFIIVTNLFSSIYIDTSHSLNWSIMVVFVTYILNKTIKPILVTLTIPITGMTLGLFYPFINVFILKLVDWLLGSYFEVKNILVAFLAAILISIMNFIMEKIIDTIVDSFKKKKGVKHE